jgi:hypothetical protein
MVVLYQPLRAGASAQVGFSFALTCWVWLSNPTAPGLRMTLLVLSHLQSNRFKLSQYLGEKDEELQLSDKETNEARSEEAIALLAQASMGAEQEEEEEDDNRTNSKQKNLLDLCVEVEKIVQQSKSCATVREDKKSHAQ